MIGTGNVAWLFATRLVKNGWDCKGIFGRNERNRHELAQALGTASFRSFEELPAADVCLLAVSDRAIEQISRELPDHDWTVVHTSGTCSLGAIVQEHAALLWPVYSIRKEKLPEDRTLPILYDCTSERAEKVALNLCRALTDHPLRCDEQQRKIYHLCAVFGNNFSNHLMSISEALAKENQLDFQVLLPLLKQTFDNLMSFSPKETQTGPALRRDIVTLNAHQKLLQNHPHWLDVYKAITASIEDMYEAGPEKKK